MKIKEFNEPIQPDTGTAQNQLLKIGQHAIKIENMIANSQEVSDWSSNKINLASDYVKKVHGYMQGEKAGLYDDGGLTEDANDQEKIKGLLQWFQNKHDTYRKDFIDDQIENGIKGSQLEQAVENNDELWELENIVNELKSGSMENAIEAINQAKYEFSGIPGEDDNFMQVIEKLGIPKDTFYFTKDESVSEDESELARLKELSGIEEGADFYGYYKDPKDPEGKTFTYPNNMEFKTPHRSNANARMLLSRIGLEPDFENTGSHLIDDFIKVTTNWLQTHEADKDTNEYDEVEMYHVEANRIKKTHPEVTHVGFN